MSGLFYWTGVAVWGLIGGGSIIIMVALIAGHITNGLKNRGRK